MPNLKDSVHDHANEVLSGTKLEKIRAPKSIRDALTATSNFERWEINIIDLPIVQRLRRIHQNALAFLTYPCATHNRFQHSLGVTNIVDRLARALRERYPSLMDPTAIHELRLAAILHDVGHGPFSHPSEEIMSCLSDVQSATRDPKFSKVARKPHEMLSYLLVTSDAFKDIVDSINRLYSLNIKIDRIANMIVGDMDNPSMEGYLSDLVNGPFDADKLDYMPRDAYFAGLKMDVDLDRIAYTCLVDERGGGHPRRLCSDISGAHNLEQILFNKILLYSSMYHHHKVRTSVCMLKSIFEIIRDHNLSPGGLSFDRAVDFLKIDDYDLISRFGLEPDLAHVMANLKNRRLLKRALVITRKTAKDSRKLQKLIDKQERPGALRQLRELITDEINRKNRKCTVYDIWLDLPESPSLREPSQCLVRLTEKDYVTLDRLFPADWWLGAYGQTKWHGHIFCPPQTRLRKLVNKAGLKILRDQFGLEFHATATDQAKIPS